MATSLSTWMSSSSISSMSFTNNTSNNTTELVFEKRPLPTLPKNPSDGTVSTQRVSVLSAALQSQEERDCQQQLDLRFVRRAILSRELDDEVLRRAIFACRNSGRASTVGSLLVLLPTDLQARQRAEIFVSLRRPEYPDIPDDSDNIRCTFW
ncbi:hypothetical protein AYL99_11034 [Fonsecaea erecta]|uniref:Uncharacterized protein n=1 Tax=Fonsecaea erecta TaxID=1367422 RepID=A0A178Z544_9EURO|nr:hypothetical protein AYL99_11034 [Fonsecaea erecta]OAP54586.1 hypothetical protein AYL99_11034 [Fonsecaea erecta]